MKYEIDNNNSQRLNSATTSEATISCVLLTFIDHDIARAQSNSIEALGIEPICTFESIAVAFYETSRTSQPHSSDT
jgi:hypothetical protein